MRKAVFGTILLFSATSLFASGTCNDPYVLMTGIAGELPSPCQGAFEYTRVDVAPMQITVNKPLDSASPKLFEACLTGQHIMQGTLKVSPSETIIIKDVTVASDVQSGDGGGSVQENLTLNFSKIEFKYTNTKPSAAAYIGAARPASMTVAVVGDNGQGGGTIQRFEIAAHHGSVTSSIQFSPTPPPIRAGLIRATHGAAAPQPHMSSGFIELRSSNGQVVKYHFAGGTMLNGNLRAQQIRFAPSTAAGLPR